MFSMDSMCPNPQKLQLCIYEYIYIYICIYLQQTSLQFASPVAVAAPALPLSAGGSVGTQGLGMI